MSSCRATSPQPARLPGAERDEAGRIFTSSCSVPPAATFRVGGEVLDDLTLQAADDALGALLGKLSDYRGASRLTTWGLQVRRAGGERAFAPARVARARGGARAQ
jgi:hypothetical protein